MNHSLYRDPETITIPQDETTDYEIAGTGKYFLINENFNLYNLTGGFDEDVCED
jgi:hypothetical protein